SRRAQTGNSAGLKNMPSLVRAALTALPPVAVSTVSERVSRERASAISSPHSSAESRSATTTMRGACIAMTTRTSRSPACSVGWPAASVLPGIGRAGLFAAVAEWSIGATPPLAAAARCSRIVVSNAASATASSQPLAFIASTTMSGGWPAAACATIQRRSSAVIGWWAMRRFCRTAARRLVDRCARKRATLPKVAAAADEALQQRRVVDQPRRDEVHHRFLALAFALPLAVDGEQRRAEQGLSLRIGDAWPDDDVDRTGFVLERDEDRTLRGLGTLAVRDEAARTREAAARERAQPRRRLDLEAREVLAQERERMAVQRQAERAVVGERLLAFARRGERHLRLVHARRAQHLGRPRVDAGDRPHRVVAMAGEARERAGVGERGERVRVEAGAAREVLGRREQRFGARTDRAALGRHRVAFERALPVADRDVDRAHLDAVLACVAHQLRRRV